MIPATQEVSRALRKMKRRRTRSTSLLLLVIVLIIAALLMATCFRPMRHTGRAMVPALADGQLIFVNLLDRTPQPGDVVLLSREMPEGGKMVRRVIALPGDEVGVTRDGTLLLGGEPLLSIPAGARDMPDTLLIPEAACSSWATTPPRLSTAAYPPWGSSAQTRCWALSGNMDSPSLSPSKGLFSCAFPPPG